MYTCPKGHQSADGDYCDVCGSPIAGASASAAPSSSASAAPSSSAAGSTAAAPQAATSAGTLCPQCQAPATGRFCEVCGYDILMASLSPAAPAGHHATGFATGSGPATASPAPPAWPTAPAPIVADPAPAKPEPPAPAPPVPEPAVAVPPPVVPDMAPPAPAAPDAVAEPDPEATADVPAFVPDAPAVPEAAVPEAAVPEAAVPEAAVPEAAVPEAAMPEAAVPEAAVPEAAVPAAPAAPIEWRLIAGADAAYHARMLAEAEPGVEPIPLPAYVPERRFELSGQQVLIGRQSKSRGIQPEIDLSGPHADPAVSHSHALLIVRPDGGWAVVDLDSSNGTYINDGLDPIDPNVPVPLSDGDRIHVGAWTTLTLQAGAA